MKLTDQPGVDAAPAVQGVRVSPSEALDVEYCIHELFEFVADQQAERPALVCGDRELTYSQLNQRANRLAHYLMSRGVRKNSFVGIYFNRSELPIVAILATLKTGATYVPIDPAFPADRIRYIIDQTEIGIFLSETALAEKAARFHAGETILLDEIEADIADFPATNVPATASGASVRNICYLIYTSGTTGRPKGVMAEHGHVYRYIMAFNKVCGTGPADRVYQGFSLGFDGSIEEIWMAFSNGSTLVVPEPDAPKFGNDLGEYLSKFGVSYFSTVPTLMSTIQDPVPSLRTLVLSGEACPEELVNRWANGKLKLWNVYGPTEATVNTSAVECLPGKTITIGKPLPGYEIYILDEQQKPVAHGDKGELFIGGKTLARGYFKRDDLTQEKFVQLDLGDGVLRRLYRTGDLVCWNDAGELEFFGRIDSQVKIRGYRVELSEIESVLLEHELIQSASVTLTEKDGLQKLAAYILIDGKPEMLDRNAILSKLEDRLPPYMVPDYLDVLDSFPMLASGKINRRELPEPQLALVRQKNTVIEPKNEMQKNILSVWQKVLGVEKICITDHFFYDLGGHSLLAAKVVTALRDQFGLDAAIKDVYMHATLEKLSGHLELVQDAQSAGATSTSVSAASVSEDVGRSRKSAREVFADEVGVWQYRLVAALQAVSIFFIYSIALAPVAAWLAILHLWVNDSISATTMIIGLWTSGFLAWPFLLTVSIASKWLLIGRYKVEEFPVWSLRYYRFWLAQKLQGLGLAVLLKGTPLYPVYLRLMGAKIGKNNLLASAYLGSCPDLLQTGDNVSIGELTQINCYRVEEGMVRFGKASLGRGCTVGINSSLGLNVTMQSGAALDDQSYLPDGETLKADTLYRGSPAGPAAFDLPKLPEADQKPRPILYGFLHLLLGYFIGAVFIVPAVATLVGAVWLMLFFPFLTSLAIGAAAVPVVYTIFCLYIAAVKRLVLNRAYPGVYSVYSWFYLRKWTSDGIVGWTKKILLPLYTTIYLPPFLRLMGAKIGRRAELSVLSYCAPEMIDLGEESFFADASIVGGLHFHRGYFEIACNNVGRRTFVGNGAILPPGFQLGDNSLLGVVSLPDQKVTPDNTDLLGSVAFPLPSRHKVLSFKDEETYCPSTWLYCRRLFVDALRIFVPVYLSLFLFGVFLLTAALPFLAESPWWFFAVLPASALALGLFTAFFTIALKWLVMGRFKPVIKPLWSRYVWLNEMLNGMYESMMTPALGVYLGTPYIRWFMRLIGCQIGERSYINSILFSEFDLVRIGAYAALNQSSVVQNHLFEDRIMKSSYVDIGESCSIGSQSVVLYDSKMAANTTIRSMSLLMKGESLQAGTTWHGIPTVPVAWKPFKPAATNSNAKPSDSDSAYSTGNKTLNRQKNQDGEKESDSTRVGQYCAIDKH